MFRSTPAHRAAKAWVKANRADRVAHFGHIHLFPDRVVRIPGRRHEPETFPLDGVSATVDTAGGIAARGTLTRSVAVSGWQKTVDTREAWLTVDGPTFQWHQPIPMAHRTLIAAARDFAQVVNTTARRTAAAGRHHTR